MSGVNGAVAWRAALIQGLAVAASGVALGLALPHSFFEDYGWAAGPGVWAMCALLTAAVLRLRPLPVLAGAALAGIPSLITVLLGAHWAGVPLAVGLFAAWCGWLAGDLGAIPGLLDGVESELGPIDIYIANTGGPPPNPDPLGFTRQEWEAAHRTLVLSPMTILERLLPQMRERGWGRVVAVSSSAVREPIAALQLSNVHRPGLIVGFKVLAKQYGADGITFNTLLPGRIATDRMIDTAGSREAAEAAAREQVPAGRLGEPGDMGAAAAFLCSEQASYITGITLLVDGGMTASAS